MTVPIIRIELMKLKGSLAVPLLPVAAALPGFLIAFASATSHDPVPWDLAFARFMLPLWATFLLPMTMAAFTVILAQIEYRASGWGFMLALPVRRWTVFASKAVLTLAAMISSTMLVIVFTSVGLACGTVLSGRSPTGAIPVPTLAVQTLLLLSGAALPTIIQLWIALRFRNLVVPLATGVAGTLVALATATTGTSRARWFPWVLPASTMAAPHPLPWVLFGLGAAITLTGLMIADLVRRRLT